MREVYELHLEIQSPLFIGDGGLLNPLSYIRDSERVYVINFERFLKGLSEREHKLYLAWLELIFEKMEEVRRKRADSEERPRYRKLASRLSLSNFIRDQLGKEPVSLAQRLGSVSYSLDWLQPPAAEIHEIHTFIKDAALSPFIPGSELKGAFRTSLLYLLLKEDRFRELEPKLRSPKERGKGVEAILRGIKKDDGKYDLLRFLEVGDAFLPLESLRLYNLKSVGTPRFIRAVAEGVREKTSTRTRFVLSVEEQSIGELGLGEISGNLSPERILRSVYLRSEEILAEATSYSYFRGHPQMQAHIRELKKKNEPSSPLLRLGWGQGFLSTTINLLTRKRDKGLYSFIVSRIRRGARDDFPKTRRVVSDARGNPLALPGWVKITLNRKEAFEGHDALE